jgi:hypothetical protein
VVSAALLMLAHVPGKAAHWVYQQVTMNRINYDNVNPDNIWDLADSGRIFANNWT